MMKEYQIVARKNSAGEKKASMKRRDDHHDYSGRRMYMITLETEGRQPLFGRLVGDAFAPAGSDDAPRIELTPLGKAVESAWRDIHGYYPQIEVMAVQMMPDHLHGILFVRAPLPVHLGQVIAGFKAGCRRAQQALAAKEAAKATVGAAAKPQPTEKAPETTHQQPATARQALPASPQAAVLPPQPLPSPQPLPPPPQPFRPLFAKGYNDLILRSYDELPVWENYLRDNPRRLLMKREQPELFRVQRNIAVGGLHFSAIGNRFLLERPVRLQVQCSRRLTEEQIAEKQEWWLQQARAGAVLVSPCISRGEKTVMRAAFNEGLPVIVLQENGFTDLAKPGGLRMDACARGQLLLLAPWEHHNERLTIRRDQCLALNEMARIICEKS